MPKLGNKKFSYDKKGLAEYTTAKKKLEKKKKKTLSRFNGLFAEHYIIRTLCI